MPPKAAARHKHRSAPTVEGGRRYLSRTARWAAEEQLDGESQTLNGTDTSPQLCAGVAVSGKSSRAAKPINLVFYGVPAFVIAEVCGVAQSTARSYKNGTRRPARSVVRLMQLWRDGRILGPEWKHWTVRKELIISPEGEEMSQGRLRAYSTCMQLLYELTRGKPYLRGQIQEAFEALDPPKRKRVAGG